MWINEAPRMATNNNVSWNNQLGKVDVFFGGRCTDGAYTQGFACELDEVAIYNKCIDLDGTFAGEVYNGGTNYDHQTNGIPGLVGYWRFNTGTGDTAVDSVGPNNGKLTNDLTPPTPQPKWIAITPGEYGP